MELNNSDLSAKPAQDDTVEDTSRVWYRAPVYSFYWRHYQRMWQWFRMHEQTQQYQVYRHGGVMYSLAQQKSYHLQWVQWLENFQRLLCRGNASGTHVSTHKPRVKGPHKSERKRKSKRKGKQRQRPHKKICVEKTTNASVTDFELSIQEDSDSEIEEFHMEFTPEMLDFYSQSAKHRQERDTKKEEKQETSKFISEDYMDLAESQDLHRQRATLRPPSERPGVKRTTEMKYLYGQGAAMIHGMETAMQLNYDRNCDRKAPKLWPNLPLNIQFS